METNNARITYLQKEVERIATCKGKYMFFVLDTKAVPSGCLEYIYSIALALHNAGKEVVMLHQEKEADFVGVTDWLGKEYGVLKHISISAQDFKVGAADILFIPDIFVNVMEGTMKMPCKRFVIVQNPDFICEFMPLGKQLGDYHIMDVITNTQRNAEIIKSWYNYVTVYTLQPKLKPVFFNTIEPKKMVINVIANDSDANKIVKPFYWKYPQFKWVTFRQIGGILQSDFADALREAAITIWCDEKTKFGYTALEAMACGSIVIGKVTEDTPVWVGENNEHGNSVVWFSSYDDLHNLIVAMVRAWTQDETPSELSNEMKEAVKPYVEGDFNADAVSMFERLMDGRKKELENTIEILGKENGNDGKNETV